MRKIIPFLLLFTVLLAAQNKKPNVIFLLVDDVGWGDFGCYGATFNETPNIDKLASEGMLFTNGYAACTVCSPSRAAILTGRYPARTHLTDWISGHRFPYAKLSVPNWEMKMDHKRILLPEALKEGGYTTTFLGKWHLMPEDKTIYDQHFPTSHGFDVNIGGREWGQPKGKGKYFSPFEMPNLDDGKPGDFLTDKLTDAALHIMDTVSKERPFFMYFAYYTIHGPIMSPPELVEKYTQKAKHFNNSKNELLNPARAGMVEKLDVSVGRILNKLDALGISENTIIILTGDNGGNFPENSGGLRDNKGYSHEGGTREPFVVKWPGITKPGTKSDAVVIGTDFYPTILEMVGLKLKKEEHKDGISFVSVLKDNDATLGRKAIYWHYPHYHRTKPYSAIRFEDWKLIEFLEDNSLELFDLKNDQKEAINLADKFPNKAQELLKRLHHWKKNVGAQEMQPNPNYDPSFIDKRGM